MNAPPQEGIAIYVGGPPVAKGRPRVTKRGFTYTPAKTRKYESHVRMAAQDAMNHRPPLDGALRMEVNVWLPVPTSWSKKKQSEALAGIVVPTKRPDVDNYAKAALDGCAGIVFRDDAQITRLCVEKGYSSSARLVINVYPVAGAKAA